MTVGVGRVGVGYPAVSAEWGADTAYPARTAGARRAIEDCAHPAMRVSGHAGWSGPSYPAVNVNVGTLGDNQRIDTHPAPCVRGGAALRWGGEALARP